MRIDDRQHYLVVSFELSTLTYHISIVEDGALQSAAWNGSTRISPIWQIITTPEDEPPKRQRKLSEDSWMCFLGPTNPPKLYSSLQTTLFTRLGAGDVWLSLGNYNFLFFLSDQEELELLRAYCDENRCQAEFWRILDDSDIADFRCDDLEYFEPEDYQDEDPRSPYPQPASINMEKLSSAIDASIKQAFLELYSLNEISRNRSRYSLNVLYDDIRNISSFIPSVASIVAQDATDDETILSGDALKERERKNLIALKYRDHILGINAGLSRHVSQALSGTSPIIQTECHFWPHSLLGTGIAILALRNLAGFIISTVNAANYNLNYYSNLTKNINQLDTQIEEFSSVVTLQIPHLVNLSLASSSGSGPREEYDIPNPITYFSGRDGFKYGMFTASAPLLSVSGCNSKQWNLGTISHELAHRVVSPKIEELLAETLEAKNFPPGLSLKELCRRDCVTVHDAAIQLILNSITYQEANRIGEERFTRAKENPNDFIRIGIQQHHHELEEKVVHMFDYYHFYNQESENYVANIWQSWAIQPTIATKFRAYVERTAIALATNHVTATNWATLTYYDFVRAAAKTNFWHQTLFREKLEQHLIQDRGEFIRTLRRNWPLIALFFLLFRSNDLAAYMEQETKDIAHARQLQLYDVSGLSFPRFTNAVKFVRQMTTDKTPNSARSAWLLSALAFGPNLAWHNEEEA